MAKLLCLLLCLVVLVNPGFSLKCYNCRAEKQEDCIKAREELECANLVAAMPVCYSMQTLDVDKKLVWEYSCGAVPEGQTIETSTLAMCLVPNVQDCKVCEDNLCNAN